MTEAEVFDGRTALITGGAGGIGAAIVRELAGRGANVAILDLADAGDTVREAEACGVQAAAFRCDLTREDEVAQAVSAVAERFGRIDHLVNNAGFFDVERRPFWEIPAAEWEKVVSVNLTGVFLCSRAVVPHMRSRRSGRIINLSSDVVTFGMPNLMHYVAAKSAVVGMTRAMARELGGDGICVNAIAPGLVATPAAKTSIPEDEFANAVSGQALPEAVEPEDIAGAVAFLCGPAGRRISGQTLLVNGGANASGI